ncbi:mannosyltransferase family protein [Lysinibacter sp. HNR]|uniref:mannosyltransferase family protein n=1 Tax=Lysinibacter sp. HNR TaxID=3031408 RepID=UPI0024358349|nr:mannosyltransferase family protein [Lysinibacter sp. HNR]WGD38370.1 mannosyltransferase family protein [Lysinibacter sp. HNR]
MITHRYGSARRRLAGLYSRVPWWAKILVIFALSRIVSTTMLLIFAAQQPAVPGWISQHPGLVEYSALWDGQWYWRIALYGYPAELPLDSGGNITENAWAFMPVFPVLVRAISLVTFLPWPAVASLVSLIFGCATVLLFYRLMLRYISESQSLFAVALYCFAPVSVLIQVAYAESMVAFLLTLALWLLVRRDYAWMFPVVGVMSLTRPVGLAFALLLGLWWLLRVLRRARDPFPPREAIVTALLGLFTAGMGFLWPAVAWVVTGSITAYTDTELAWRRPYVGDQHLVPFTPWFQGANWWVGSSWGSILLVLVLLAVVACFWLPQVRRLGIELRLWCISYGVYLLAVFFPQSSTFRMLMPLFPLLGAIAQPSSKIYRTVLIGISIYGQWVWNNFMWAISLHDWTPP